MVKVSTWVEPDLAERVRRAAEKEGRSVSQWLRLLLERELAGEAVRGRPDAGRKAQMEQSFHPLGCPHDEVEKRTTAALGTRRFCKDCGVLLP